MDFQSYHASNMSLEIQFYLNKGKNPLIPKGLCVNFFFKLSELLHLTSLRFTLAFGPIFVKYFQSQIDPMDV